MRDSNSRGLPQQASNTAHRCPRRFAIVRDQGDAGLNIERVAEIGKLWRSCEFSAARSIACRAEGNARTDSSRAWSGSSVRWAEASARSTSVLMRNIP